MIVKNEEQTLPNCLESAKAIADEIIIVDTGSTDNTKQIAAKFTDKIFDFQWVEDFSAARNFSFSKATKDYILWLDADDILLSTDQEKLGKLKKSLPADTAVVMLKYNTGFDKDGNVTFSFYRERLVRRTANFKWKEPVHEYIETFGKTIKSDICITHTKKPKAPNGRNLRIYENLLKNNGALSPRGTYYYARELRDSGMNREAVQYFEAFLNAGKGWVEDNIAACGALSDCLNLLGDHKKALLYLLKSFDYDIPRPDICCRLGYHFEKQNKYSQAIYWFQSALDAAQDQTTPTLGFRQEDYMGYIPCIELAVCYNQLGDIKKAFEFNEMAAAYKPNCPSVLHNRDYFNKLSAMKESGQ